MPKYTFFNSARKDKRFAVMNPDGKVINFGSPTATTFLDGATEKKKDAYIARHSKNNEDWDYSGRDTPGFWARHALWSANNIKDVKKYLKKRFGIELVVDSETKF